MCNDGLVVKMDVKRPTFAGTDLNRHKSGGVLKHPLYIVI